MSTYSDMAEPRGGGLRSAVSATLWIAGSVGAVSAVMIWAFDLGARNPADIPALTAAGDWRARPADPEGRRLPGQNRLVYDPIAGGAPRSAASVSSAFGAARVERAPEQDLKPAPPLSEIAMDKGSVLGGRAFAALSNAAAREPEATTRRTILLDDPLQPQRSVRDYGAPGAPRVPANVGSGAEPPPPNASFFKPEAAMGDIVPPPADARERPPGAAEPLTTDMPPDAEPAAMSAGDSDAPPPAPQTEKAAAAASIDAAIAELAPEAPPTQSRGGPQTFQAQLAALDSVRAVEERWEQLKSREPELLKGFSLEIRPVNVGGARLYRLRVGAFKNRSDAARLCVILRERGVECFPAAG